MAQKKFWLVKMRNDISLQEINGIKINLDSEQTTFKKIDDINIIAQPADVSKVKLSLIKMGKKSIKPSKKYISGMISINRMPEFH